MPEIPFPSTGFAWLDWFLFVGFCCALVGVLITFSRSR